MPSPNEITPTQLNRLIGTPVAPDLIDLRIDDDFDDDPRLIPGAFRHARTDLEVLLPPLDSRPVVVYCQKGCKMSRWSQRNFLQHRLIFDTFLAEFDLAIPALDTVATIVRGADTNRHDLAPEAAGLLAFSVGLSRMYRDDLEQLEAGMTFYDALFRWARDAQDEGHDWPTSRRS